MVPTHALRTEAGFRFLNFLLSERGQAVAEKEVFFFGRSGQAPPGVEGASSIIESGVARPISIGPTLLAVQDDEGRRRFIKDWSRSLVEMAAE